MRAQPFDEVHGDAARDAGQRIAIQQHPLEPERKGFAIGAFYGGGIVERDQIVNRANDFGAGGMRRGDQRRIFAPKSPARVEQKNPVARLDLNFDRQIGVAVVAVETSVLNVKRQTQARLDTVARNFPHNPLHPRLKGVTMCCGHVDEQPRAGRRRRNVSAKRFAEFQGVGVRRRAPLSVVKTRQAKQTCESPVKFLDLERQKFEPRIDCPILPRLLGAQIGLDLFIRRHVLLRRGDARRLRFRRSYGSFRRLTSRLQSPPTDARGAGESGALR